MPDHEFVCHECGRTFRGLTTHIGEEMCPACGSIDIELAPMPSPASPSHGRPPQRARAERPFRRRLTTLSGAG